MDEPETFQTGLVLSGGGARGAYEAGVLTGIVDILGLDPKAPCPFRIFAGTSVGAINAAFVAAHAHRGDMAVDRLVDMWRSLRLRTHLRPNPWGLLPFGLRRIRPSGRSPFSRSLLDPRPMERLVDAAIPWGQLRRNIRDGTVEALFVPALNALDGRTTVFAQLHERAVFAPSFDPRRVARLEAISCDHVMASAAIPLVFPARRVGDSYYFDGGLRFNTPIAPVLRAGAQRLVLISLLTGNPTEVSELKARSEPSIPFLLGKLLDALLLDRVDYDLQLLERLNALLEVLDRALPPESLAEIQRLLVETRGAPYQHIRSLVFRPSEDVGSVASAYLHEHARRWSLDAATRWLLARFAAEEQHESDWASYLLFDGGFADRLIQMGIRDAHNQADQVRTFFSDQA